MKCPNCSNEVPETANVCGYCGQRLKVYHVPESDSPPAVEKVAKSQKAGESATLKHIFERWMPTFLVFLSLVGVGLPLRFYLSDVAFYSLSAMIFVFLSIAAVKTRRQAPKTSVFLWLIIVAQAIPYLLEFLSMQGNFSRAFWDLIIMLPIIGFCLVLSNALHGLRLGIRLLVCFFAVGIFFFWSEPLAGLAYVISRAKYDPIYFSPTCDCLEYVTLDQEVIVKWSWQADSYQRAKDNADDMIVNMEIDGRRIPYEWSRFNDETIRLEANLGRLPAGTYVVNATITAREPLTDGLDLAPEDGKQDIYSGKIDDGYLKIVVLDFWSVVFRSYFLH